jgi:lactose/L-arabinose transport system permease protein
MSTSVFSERHTARLFGAIRYGLLLLAAFLSVFPFFWMLIGATTSTPAR